LIAILTVVLLEKILKDNPEEIKLQKIAGIRYIRRNQGRKL